MGDAVRRGLERVSKLRQWLPLVIEGGGGWLKCDPNIVPIFR